MTRRPLLLPSALQLVLLAANGAWAPYFLAWMAASGVSPAATGTIFAASGLARVLATPLWGYFADRFRRIRGLLQLSTWASAVAGAAILVSPPVAIGVLTAILAAIRAPAAPLVDAVAIRTTERMGRPDLYGRARLWGSLGFLLAGNAAALVADVHPAWPLALGLALWVAAGLLASGVPDDEAPPPTGVNRAVRGLFDTPRAWAFWAAATLHGVALSVYDSFYAVHLAHIGLPKAWTGPALAAGITTEIAVFYTARFWLRLGDPMLLVAIAMAVAAPRWALTATLTDPWALTALASTHAITFALFWLAAVESTRREFSDAARASATSTLVAFAYGIGPMCNGLLAAAIPDTRALYWIAAACSALGAALVLVARKLPAPVK